MVVHVYILYMIIKLPILKSEKSQLIIQILLADVVGVGGAGHMNYNLQHNLK